MVFAWREDRNQPVGKPSRYKPLTEAHWLSGCQDLSAELLSHTLPHGHHTTLLPQAARRVLTNALDTVHEQVNLLARPQLGDEDIIVHRPDSTLWEEVSLIPQGHPCHVPGVHWRKQHIRKAPVLKSSINKRWAFLLPLPLLTFVVHIEFVGVRGIFSGMGVPRAPDLKPELQSIYLCAFFIS